MKSTYVSGPINCIRLEGQVNSVKKVLYVFMDLHMDVNEQTECDDVLAPDIKTYLINLFGNIKNSEKTYDFFLETHPSHVFGHVSNYKDIYLNEVRKLFKKEFVMNDTVSNAKDFPNLRLHYMDIRDYVVYKNDIFPLDQLCDYAYYLWKNTEEILEYQCNKLIDELNKCKEINDKLYKLISKPELSNSKKNKLLVKNFDEYNAIDYESSAKYIVIKMLNKYKHDVIKDKLNKLINEYLTNLYSLINESHKELEKTIKKCKVDISNTRDKVFCNKSTGVHYGMGLLNTKTFLYNLYKESHSFYIQNQRFFASLMDFYFLRRFLDKDYITNAIGYTGSYHSQNYIYYLVKYFDFKITHWSLFK